MIKRIIIKLVYGSLLLPILSITFGNNTKSKILDNTILESQIIKDNITEIQANINNTVAEESSITEMEVNDKTSETNKKDIIEKIEIVEQKQNIIQNQKQSNNNQNNKTLENGNNNNQNSKILENGDDNNQNSKTLENSNCNNQDTKEIQNQGTQENFNQKNERKTNGETLNTPINKEIENETKLVITEKYEKNENESKMLKSEFERITGNNNNFSAEIKSDAKNGYCFYPYRESEIKKQLKDITFGSFEVYAEDVYSNGVKKRTNYYIK